MNGSDVQERTEDRGVDPFARPDVPHGLCPETTPDVLQRAAFLVPELEAVVCGEDRVTYAGLAERVARASAVLRGLGVGLGDRVALCLGNGPRWVELFYAITGLGAVVVAVNTRFRSQDLGYVLRHSGARVLLTAPAVMTNDFLVLLRELGVGPARTLPTEGLPALERVVVLDDASEAEVPEGWERFSGLTADASSDPRPGPAPKDVALVQYTSGTTSRPKGVLLTHRNMCLNAFVSALRMGLRAGDRFHSVRPFFHVAGSTLSVLSSAQALATLVTMPRFEPGAALAVLEAERCTHFSGNDTIALMLLDHPDRPSRHLHLRGAWVAASPAVLRRVTEELGATEVVAGYGQSEASPNVAQSAWWEPAEVRLSAAMAPEPGVRVRVRDLETGGDAPVGVCGEIQVSGWNVMVGYLDQPEQTAQASTADGWLRTGDLGVLDAAGRLTFTGRLKEMLRVGGENVSPGEIEEELLQHPGVRQAAVVPVPDARLLEVPFAFVVRAEGADVDGAELQAWLKRRVAGFKVPRHVHFVEDFASLAMTASSKVQRGQLVDHAKRIAQEERGR